MAFDVAAGAYAQFMGRYAEPLADQFAELVGIRPGQRALDVGCGPGALTERLVARLGAHAVAAVDPSTSFIEAVRARCAGADVRLGTAENLPFDDDSVDLSAAQLVVHFMSDPVAGLQEMARVTRPGGQVAANIWDFHGGRAPQSVFWGAVRDLDPAATDESDPAGAREGHLAELFRAAGLTTLRSAELTVVSSYTGFDEWWHPYTLLVGPPGDYVAGLEPDSRRALEERCRRLLPDGPFDVTATAWAVVARTG
ncbi:methyltransferase family protein [Promicromonospora sp. AC04]|uniref:class I SAM-dependent methyltransferase n=1 Tax=Promicromonospora sp. AC04 TaxID=2135723 RepID=UPI000D335D43|nr:class I SAM-dependent methyltransferase [Promicromonospora sp. AC04]PUB31686.1 methyltransferase family protein [Promicromonospora sp. AC04]